MRTHLVDLLVRQDKMTMGHGVENRVPFLDRHVIEFARALPAEHLVGPSFPNGVPGTKIVVKELARRSFDAAFVYRRKSAFNLPLAQYFRSGPFVALMEDRLLPGMASRGLVDVERRSPLVAPRPVGAVHHRGILDPGGARVVGAAIHRRTRQIRAATSYEPNRVPGVIVTMSQTISQVRWCSSVAVQEAAAHRSLLDPVPQVLQPEVLVEALVVVIGIRQVAGFRPSWAA